MKEKHFKYLFMKYQEKRLSAGELNSLNLHLKECAECREYFRRADSIFNTDLTPALELEPDQYLPARIKALADRNRREKLLEKKLKVKQFSLVSLASAAAVAIGIFLGSGFNNYSIQSTQRSGVYSAYYNAFSQQSVADKLESALSAELGGKK